MAGRRDAGACPVMSAFTPRATTDDWARLYVLEAPIEILKRQLVTAETWAAQAVITKRLDAQAPERPDRGGASWWAEAPGLAWVLSCLVYPRNMRKRQGRKHQ